MAPSLLRGMRPRALATVAVVLFVACREPVPSSGGPGPEAAPGGEAAEDRSPVGAAADRAEGDPVAPAEGVLADLHWLGGKREEEAAERIDAWLGPVTGEVDRLTRGREIRHEHGVVRLVGGRIVMVRFDLPEPMTRAEALQATGFPTDATGWRATHREYRLGRRWGFERFRLARAPGGSERVVSVEAWKERPERP